VDIYLELCIEDDKTYYNNEYKSNSNSNNNNKINEICYLCRLTYKIVQNVSVFMHTLIRHKPFM